MTPGEPVRALGDEMRGPGDRPNLGCGRHEGLGTMRVNRDPRGQADLLRDLGARRLPVRDGVFDEVHLNMGSGHQYHQSDQSP